MKYLQEIISFGLVLCTQTECNNWLGWNGELATNLNVLKNSASSLKRQREEETKTSSYLRTNLVFSVLPAPDSPETIIDWLIFRTFMSL